MLLKSEQAIKQLEKRKGGYFYLSIDAEVVEVFPKKRTTRLICEIDQKVSFACGLNHLGDGNFYVIVSTKNLKATGKSLGDKVYFEIQEDPNPLGVEVPEVLAVLLDQDENSKQVFDSISDGKKRSLIYTILKMKDVDKQVATILQFLEEQKIKLNK